MDDADPQVSDFVGSTYDLERWLETVGRRSEVLMDILELTTAFIMIALFAIGVYDLALKLFTLVLDGTYTDPQAVLKVIDTTLLLLIIVEIYRTVVAYVEDLNILPVVLNVAIIAMARKIISFRTGKYATNGDAIQAAAAYGLLMVILIAAFYFIHRIQHETEFNIYAAGEVGDEGTG